MYSLKFAGMLCCCYGRGLTDALVAMEKAMKRDKIEVNDRQLACARINSQEGQDYLKGMAAAANYAWVNRSCMTFLTRQVLAPSLEHVQHVFLQFIIWKNSLSNICATLLLRRTLYCIAAITIQLLDDFMFC